MQYLLIDLLIVGVYAFEESTKAAKCVAVLSRFVFHCSFLVEVFKFNQFFVNK